MVDCCGGDVGLFAGKKRDIGAVGCAGKWKLMSIECVVIWVIAHFVKVCASPERSLWSSLPQEGRVARSVERANGY